MFGSLVSRSKIVSYSLRNCYVTTRFCSNKPAESNPSSSTDYAQTHRRMHNPSDFDKKMLKWTGRYKTIEEIPESIPVETLEKAKNKFRIKVANYMMGLTLVACLIMSITGKRAAERGESVAQMNIDWHKQVNKEPK